MYKVMQNGNLIGHSDEVVWIKLHRNGSYVPCPQAQAEGFCAKVAKTVTDPETGEVFNTVHDTVYALTEGAMKGTEEVAYLEQTNGAVVILDTQDQLVAVMQYQQMLA